MTYAISCAVFFCFSINAEILIDPFELIIAKHQNGSERFLMNKNEVLFQFPVDLKYYVIRIIRHARKAGKYLSIAKNKSVLNSEKQIYYVMHESNSSLDSLWYVIDPEDLVINNGFFCCHAGLVFNTLFFGKEKFKIYDKKLLKNIVKKIEKSRKASKEVEINIMALKTERHQKYMPLSSVIKISD